MSNDLTAKLKTYTEKKRVLALLEQIKTLDFVQFVDSSQYLDKAYKVYRDTWKIDAKPTAKINIDVAETDIKKFLWEWLQNLEVGNKCYLRLSNFDYLPWIEVKIQSELDWLIDLWELTDIHIMAIVTIDTAKILAIFEEEYNYDIFLKDF